MPVACALVPRFRLIAAVSDRGTLARPAALAPEPGAAQLIGEVTEAAERFGLRPGMRMGEALSRCPELALVPPDPERAESAWEEALRRLEGIGAAVESERAGEAFFEAGGLAGLWGGIEGVLERAHRDLGASARLGAGPGRFCAYVAARSSAVVPDAAAAKFLDPMPVSLLCGRLGDEADDLPNEFERLGISTLGRLAELPRDAVADRFGRLGLRARRLARGEDEPLRPRPVREAIAVELELPEAVSGQQLERSLELLISRLLAHGARRGRTLRSLRLSARLAAGGGWRRQIALRRASADRARLADALLPHLSLLPAPAATLRLEAVALGPETGEQLTLSSPERERRQRISEAVRQTRSAAGADAVLRVLEVDPESRVPERREVLMPFPEELVMTGSRQQALAGAGPDGAGRRAAGGRAPGGGVGARGVAGRGRLVDAETPAKALLRAGARGRQRRRRLHANRTGAGSGSGTDVRRAPLPLGLLLPGRRLRSGRAGGRGGRARTRGAGADRPRQRLRGDGVRARLQGRRGAADRRLRADGGGAAAAVPAGPRHALGRERKRLGEPLPADHRGAPRHPRAGIKRVALSRTLA